MLTGIELFKQRFEGYKGEVILVDSEQAAMQKAIEIIEKTGITKVGISQDLEKMTPVLTQAGIGYVHDLKDNTEPPDIGITRASGILAETGSLVISNDNPGERLWSIICETHIAIIVNPKLFSTLDDLFSGDFSLLDTGFCLISGPSRTADIEKQLVLGMHGPGRVIAIIAG